jgi:hypothetical protein
MRTCGKVAFQLPIEKLNLQVSTLSPLPKTYWGALLDPYWWDTMIEEFTALQASNTWDLVPHPSGGNIITSKWVFRQSSILMALMIGTRHDGCSRDSLSSQVLISVRPSVPCETSHYLDRSFYCTGT